MRIYKLASEVSHNCHKCGLDCERCMLLDLTPNQEDLSRWVCRDCAMKIPEIVLLVLAQEQQSR